MLVTVIGRGHSGTRAMSQTLLDSGVMMGADLNDSYDLIPPEDMYEACRVMGKYVKHLGNLNWDFSALHTMPIDPAFTRLVESFLASVLSSSAEKKGWKLPETTLVYPWIVRMFPEAHYVHWVRDPRDSILGKHVTDDLRVFDIDYDFTDDVHAQRAISWKYQREIVKATPAPIRAHQVRFEDFVLKQHETLKGLEGFLSMPLVKIPVQTAPVGRWKTSEERCWFPFFEDDVRELGYEST